MFMSMLSNSFTLLADIVNTYVINKPVPFNLEVTIVSVLSRVIAVSEFVATVATPILLYKIYKEIKK